MDEILPLAMAGTQRRAPSFQAALFEGLSGSPESQLLAAAALASVTRLAGQSLAGGTSLPADTSTDPRPLAKTVHLQQIVEGDYRSLLDEWLELAHAAGKRLDPALLPELLEIGKMDRSVRLNLARVAGPRAFWLATHNPEWAYLLGESQDLSVWETGKATVRVDWLAGLRERDPAQARQLLTSTWSQESADDRSRFLETLKTGLSLEDEDFLESGLDDRSKGVRRQAAALLSALPGSKLGARMAARLQAWVVEKTDRASLKLEIVTSGECSPEMLRDGVEPKSPRSDVGDKAWWLQQIVALAPLNVWKASPAELLGAKSDWKDSLLQGWIEAATRQAHRQWAQAILATGYREDQLFALLPREQQEQAIVSCPEPPMSWLRIHGHYSPRLAQKLLQWMQARTALAYDYHWGNAFPELARGFPPGMEVSKGWPDAMKSWSQPVESFIATVKFRQSMQEEMRL